MCPVCNRSCLSTPGGASYIYYYYLLFDLAFWYLVWVVIGWKVCHPVGVDVLLSRRCFNNSVERESDSQILNRYSVPYTDSLTHSLTHSFIHLLTYLLSQLLTQPFTQSVTFSLIYLPTHLTPHMHVCCLGVPVSFGVDEPLQRR